jgi:hypothetical protein
MLHSRMGKHNETGKENLSSGYSCFCNEYLGPDDLLWLEGSCQPVRSIMKA